MRTSFSLWLRLCLTAFLLAGFGIWTAAVPTPGRGADEKGRKKAEEVEEDEGPPAKQPRRKTTRPPEAEEADAWPDESRPVDLAAEAKRATGDIRKFYESLAEPHDNVFTVWGRVDHVEPLSRYVGRDPEYPGRLEMTRIDKDGKHRRLSPVPSKHVKKVIHYEELVLQAVKDLVEKKEVPRLVAGENALVAALRVHAGRAKAAEDERKWADVEEKLRMRLHELRREHAAALGKAGHWPEAFRLARQLVKDHPRDPDDWLVLARLTLARAEDSGVFADYLEARARLLAFESRFPQNTKAGPLRKGLAEAAAKLVKEAGALVEKDKAGAIDRLRKAAKIWPQLPDLLDKLRTLDRDHPILYVGVRALPTHFSPATAVTDTDRQAVELLFEGLVKQSTAAGGALRYNPALAEGRPRVVPHGREFTLARDAFWSDGRRVTATDVRHTVHLLKSADLDGRNSAWGRLVEDPRVEGSAYQVAIALRHGFIDPLSLMTFKVLPHEYQGRPLDRADDKDFGACPVGSGPFVLQGPATEEDTNYLVFAANPYYQRAGRPGRPRIREIRFFVTKDPGRALRNERLHLLPDVRTSEIPDLVKKHGFREDDIRTLPNRRVYFLAVNHNDRDSEALQNLELRQALAHGIDREALLKSHFRAGFEGIDGEHRLVRVATPDTTKLHPALNGPYPAGSWACSPDVRANLFDPDKARLKARAALKKLRRVKLIELKLTFPDDDPRVKAACNDMCEQLSKLADGLRIRPRPLTPDLFRRAINQRDYQLAYCHYDYASEAFWLWPLFDPDKTARAPGGSNILRYHNDSTLESYFRSAMTRRDFKEIKKLTHFIHNRLNDRMPLVPLWQLHTHVAAHPRLEATGLDPLLVFTNAEEWRLEGPG
jgi:ABC-type transport system substrate-binding protein